MRLDQNKTTGVLKISGALQIDEVKRLYASLCECVENQPSIALDLSEVDSCDTASLQVLLAAHKTAALRGKYFCFTAISEEIQKKAVALGLFVETSADLYMGELSVQDGVVLT
jgi:anti-anti-sigma factor